jgi:hypothetical protein
VYIAICFFIYLILQKVGVSLGYLFMDELQRAVAPFPHASGGGMSGSEGNLGGSSGDPGGTSWNEASSASVSTSSDDSSSVDQASGFREKSALDQRKEELLMDNLKERKGDLGDGQRISTVRQTVETDLHVSNKGQEFELIKQIEKETGAKKEDCPVTNSTFNEIKEFQSKIQDGTGGR